MTQICSSVGGVGLRGSSCRWSVRGLVVKFRSCKSRISFRCTNNDRSGAQSWTTILTMIRSFSRLLRNHHTMTINQAPPRGRGRMARKHLPGRREAATSPSHGKPCNLQLPCPCADGEPVTNVKDGKSGAMDRCHANDAAISPCSVSTLQIAVALASETPSMSTNAAHIRQHG